jgi:pimeloyl-ACP methyl ester carboxylesterase
LSPQKEPVQVLTQTLQDEHASFTVTVLEPAASDRTVLFAVGAGGHPERHKTFMETLAKAGCRVIAPHFEQLASPVPTEDELLLRARRLCLALDKFGQPNAKTVGVGHSIGAATLLALAGAQMWLGPERQVNIVPDSRLASLVLLAPPTGFFQAPGALDSVRTPTLVWVGSADNITPPVQTKWLANTMRQQCPVELRITEGAGHFSFMDMSPPQTIEPLPNKAAFLQEYSKAVCNFIIG